MSVYFIAMSVSGVEIVHPSVRPVGISGMESSNLYSLRMNA